MTFTRSNKN